MPIQQPPIQPDTAPNPDLAYALLRFDAQQEALDQRVARLRSWLDDTIRWGETIAETGEGY